ncbi:MAG: ATP-binding protein [Desulfosoma sp.]
MTKALRGSGSAEENASFQRKVHTYLVLRLLAAVFLLAVTFVFQLRLSRDVSEPMLTPLYIYAAVLFSVTLFSAFVLPRVWRHGLFAAAQFAFDIMAVTFLIYHTGGVTSPFPFLYMALIMAAAVLFQRRGSFLVAAAAIIAYGVLLDLQYFGWVHPSPFMGRGTPPVSSDVYFYTLLVTMTAFFLVAFLSGYLATELQKSARLSAQQSQDMERLEFFYRRLVENLGAGLLSTDTQGIITYANRAAQGLLDTAEHPLEGRPIDQVLPGLAGCPAVRAIDGVPGSVSLRPGHAAGGTPGLPEKQTVSNVGARRAVPLRQAALPGEAHFEFSDKVSGNGKPHAQQSPDSAATNQETPLSNAGEQDKTAQSFHAPSIYLVPKEAAQDRGNPSRVFEIMQETSSGEKRSFVVTMSPLETVSRGRASVIVFQDQTELKALQERMKRLEQLAFAGKMAGEVVHDIKNPLAAISGVIQMMASHWAEDDVSQRLYEILTREIERLNTLVSRFLWIAREGKASERPEPVSIAETIRQVLEALTMSKHLTDRHRVHVDVPEELKVTLVPRHLFQILWHLVANAAEALPNGGLVRIAARSHTHEDGRFGILLKVADSGAGVSEDVIQKMFEPLFTTKEGHLGLGLSLVSRLVEEAEGRIHVGSSAAFPMCVRVFFPQP